MELKEHLDYLWTRSRQASPARLAGITRERLMTYFGGWGLLNGAEIGVERGKFSAHILNSIPGSHMICVDNWNWRLRGIPKYESAVERLTPMNATIMKMTSMEAAPQIPDGSLDFVYIDANHSFDFVIEDIIEWTKKVRLGGLISGHDYYRFRGGGVVEAVNAYTLSHDIRYWFITDEKYPTWFWMKRAEQYNHYIYD